MEPAFKDLNFPNSLLKQEIQFLDEVMQGPLAIKKYFLVLTAKNFFDSNNSVSSFCSSCGPCTVSDP